MNELTVDYAVAPKDGRTPIGLFFNIPAFHVCRYVYVRLNDYSLDNEYEEAYQDYVRFIDDDVRLEIAQIMNRLCMQSYEHFRRTGRQSRAFMIKPYEAVMLFPWTNAQMTGCLPNTQTFETRRWKATHDPRRGMQPTYEQSNNLRLV